MFLSVFYSEFKHLSAWLIIQSFALRWPVIKTHKQLPSRGPSSHKERFVTLCDVNQTPTVYQQILKKNLIQNAGACSVEDNRLIHCDVQQPTTSKTQPL